MHARLSLAGIAAVLALVGCSDSGPTLAPSQTRISIADAITAGLVGPGLTVSASGTLVAISPDTVASLEIKVVDIAYLPVGGSENTDGAWVSLQLPDTVTLDLMDLPTQQQGSIEIASGSVPVGSYKMVRLLVGVGEITFTGPITVGGVTFDGATAYPVTIPSGDQTGLKTDVSFEVTEDAGGIANAAYLVFEPGTTFQNVTATGSGTINLTPVLRAP